MLRTSTGVPPATLERAAHDATLASLRARLNAGAFERAWAVGQALSLEQATAVATAVRVPEDAPAPELSAGADQLPAGTARSTTQAFQLTPRELDVLRLLTRGLTYAQIGETLVISPRTVDAHVRAIFDKLDVRSRGAATHVALQHRLV